MMKNQPGSSTVNFGEGGEKCHLRPEKKGGRKKSQKGLGEKAQGCRPRLGGGGGGWKATRTKTTFKGETRRIVSDNKKTDTECQRQPRKNAHKGPKLKRESV